MTNTFCQTNYVDKNLKEVEIKLNKMAPMMIDSLTRLDSVKAIPNSTLQYNCTLTRSNKEQINVAAFKEIMESLWIKEMKTAPEFKVFYKNNVKLNYNYYDKKGELVCSIYITPEKYKN